MNANKPGEARRPLCCPLCDEVVAHFLDGEVPAGGMQARAALDEHRIECDDCRAALGQARRLDAFVALSSRPQPLESDALDRWVDGALSDPAPVAGRWSARSSTWRAVAAVLLVAFGVVIGWAVSRRTGEVRVVPDALRLPVTAQVSDRTAAIAEGAIVLPDVPARGVRRRVGVVASPRALIEARSLEIWAVPFVLLRDGALSAPRSARSVAETVRRRAAARLARSVDPNLRGELVELCGQLPDDRRLHAALGAARAGRTFQAALARVVRSADAEILRAAARIGGVAVDRALVAACGGDPEGAVRTAGWAAEVFDRPGRVRLILELWTAIEAKGGGVEARTLATRLCADLGVHDVADLVEILDTSRHGALRRRCLHALAAAADPRATDALVRLLDAPNRAEAALAAFALGRVPAGSDDLATRRVGSRAVLLWWAALASRGDPRAAHRVDSLSLTPEETALLHGGGFSPDQIPIVARLFRARRAASD